MGPITPVRPAVHVLSATTQHPSAGTQANSTAAAAHNAGRADPVGTTETARPVYESAATAASGAEHAENSYLIETARARAEAAQRFYQMAALASGKNPLNDPIR